MGRLHRLGLRFGRAAELSSVLGEVVEAAIAITRADMGNLQLLDPGTGALRIAAQRGHEQWWVDFFSSVEEGLDASCGLALATGARVIVDDVAQSPVFIGTPGLEVQLRAGIRAVQSTPLLSSSGALVGMLSTHFRVPTTPEPDDLRLLDLLAQQLVEVLDRQRLEETRNRDSDRWKLDLLNRLSRELRDPLAPIRNSILLLEHSRAGTMLATHALRVLKSQTERFVQLVEDLLPVSARNARGPTSLEHVLGPLRATKQA